MDASWFIDSSRLLKDRWKDISFFFFFFCYIVRWNCNEAGLKLWGWSNVFAVYSCSNFFFFYSFPTILFPCSTIFFHFFFLPVSGYEWVGWRNDTPSMLGRPVEITFEFDYSRNFTAIHLHMNNYFTKDVQVRWIFDYIFIEFDNKMMHVHLFVGRNRYMFIIKSKYSNWLRYLRWSFDICGI